MAGYRAALPQLADRVFLTDGGIETTLIYHDGLELPDFAAFVLMADEPGGGVAPVFVPYVEIARDAGLRRGAGDANLAGQPGLGRAGSGTRGALDAANRAAVDMLVDLAGVRDSADADRHQRLHRSRGDGYQPG